MTYNLDLLFEDQPILEVGRARWQRAKVFIKACSGDHDGRRFITSECVSIGEFEAEIDRLHAELETLRMKARGEFQAAKSAPAN